MDHAINSMSYKHDLVSLMAERHKHVYLAWVSSTVNRLLKIKKMPGLSILVIIFNRLNTVYGYVDEDIDLAYQQEKVSACITSEIVWHVCNWHDLRPLVCIETTWTCGWSVAFFFWSLTYIHSMCKFRRTWTISVGQYNTMREKLLPSDTRDTFRNFSKVKILW